VGVVGGLYHADMPTMTLGQIPIPAREQVHHDALDHFRVRQHLKVQRCHLLRVAGADTVSIVSIEILEVSPAPQIRALRRYIDRQAHHRVSRIAVRSSRGRGLTEPELEPPLLPLGVS
jgi:hypothetical protein